MEIADDLGYRILRRIRPVAASVATSDPPQPYLPKLLRLVGEAGLEQLRGKTILDFGCGSGAGSIELALHGARNVIGLDIRPTMLEAAARAAHRAGVSANCSFTMEVHEPVDAIVSIDAFEHFADPAGMLRMMCGLLRDDGVVLVSFGPTWFHPRGGHLFSVFPWSHLMFSEGAQLRWRSRFKDDGATRYSEVEGGLNQMTIKRFERLVQESELILDSFRAIPIRPLAWAHNGFTREFTTSCVECVLVKRSRA